MSPPVPPDPPNKFSSYESWIRLTNSALSRWQVLWVARDRLLSNLDTTIAFYEREHGRLTAAYEEERRRYLVAHATMAVVRPGSNAERDSLRLMYQHLLAAAHIYDRLIDGRRKVERKFEAWMDLQGFDGRPKGRDAHGELSQLRFQMRQQRQDALSDRLVFGKILASIRKRLEEFVRSSERSEAALAGCESGVLCESIQQ